MEPWAFTDDFARERLLRQFDTAGLKGFGIEELPLAQRAAGAVLHYLGETHHDRLGHVRRIAKLANDGHVWLDRFTVRNLELVAPVNEGGHTLLAAMDRCETPMGARLLRRWLLFPLVDEKAIGERLDHVQALLEASVLRDAIGDDLRAVGDLERLAAKAAVGRINPRELLQMARAIQAAERVRGALDKAGGILAATAKGWMVPLEIAEHISASIEPETPVNIQKGGVIRTGVDADLDELRHVTTHAKELLMEVQRREVDLVLVMAVVQHRVEVQVVDLGDRRDVAGNRMRHFHVVLALHPEQVRDLERLLAVVDEQLGVLLHRALVDPEDPELADERVVDDLEPVSYTHLRAHETVLDLVCRLLLEKHNAHLKKEHIPRKQCH